MDYVGFILIGLGVAQLAAARALIARHRFRKVFPPYPMTVRLTDFLTYGAVIAILLGVLALRLTPH